MASSLFEWARNKGQLEVTQLLASLFILLVSLAGSHLVETPGYSVAEAPPEVCLIERHQEV